MHDNNERAEMIVFSSNSVEFYEILTGLTYLVRTLRSVFVDK